MILKIILLIIFFQLFFECFREGMEDYVYDTDPPFLGIDVEDELNENILYPIYNPEDKTYHNDNNFLFYNRSNISKYANIKL
jgi:hypothetical protein